MNEKVNMVTMILKKLFVISPRLGCHMFFHLKIKIYFKFNSSINTKKKKVSQSFYNKLKLSAHYRSK